MGVNCTGINCPQQIGSVDPANCKIYESCPNRTAPNVFVEMLKEKYPKIHSWIFDPNMRYNNGLNLFISLGRGAEAMDLYAKQGEKGLEKMEKALKMLEEEES